MVPKKLLFTGGEPLIYINLINEIINCHPDSSSTEVQITTNGLLLRNGNIDQVLKSIIKVDSLQLSFDIYHGSSLKEADILEIKKYCEDNKIRFNISTCISSLKQMLEIEKISQRVDAEITYQKVQASGRAKVENVEFEYPSFEEEVFSKRCPALDQVSYICEKGFSTCCSNLIFNNDAIFSYNENLTSYLQSTFYKRLNKMTFQELAVEYGVDISSLPPEYSSPCKICEYIHMKGSKQGSKK
jgi:MoaA/NifB/PqqE/SkfB family radical SAM enzyme